MQEASRSGYVEDPADLLSRHGLTPEAAAASRQAQDEHQAADLHVIKIWELMQAAEEGDDAEVRRILLEGEVSVNARTPGGASALHQAARYGQSETALLLLQVSSISSYLSVYLYIYAHPQVHISTHAQSVKWTHQKYNGTLKNGF